MTGGAADGERLFLITGGPGSGKTSLLAALAERGHACAPESGRAVIQEEVARGGTALPWADRSAFARAMFLRDRQAWEAARAAPGPMLFDRGLPDIVGYLRLCDLPVPDDIHVAAARCRYAPRAFIAPPWEAIFHQDAERKQDLAEAVRTHAVMEQVYTELGYTLLPLPQVPVDARADWVEACLWASPQHDPPLQGEVATRRG